MTAAVDIPLDALIAHRPPMRFLDRVIEGDENSIVAETTVCVENPLFCPGRGLPAYAGLEMMAQAIAAIDGMKRRLEGLSPKIGFLLGCRRYRVACKDFPEGARLRISAEMAFTDGSMFTFDCKIADVEGAELATASMNVYAPSDPSKFLNGNLG